MPQPNGMTLMRKVKKVKPEKGFSKTVFIHAQKLEQQIPSLEQQGSIVLHIESQHLPSVSHGVTKHVLHRMAAISVCAFVFRRSGQLISRSHFRLDSRSPLNNCKSPFVRCEIFRSCVFFKTSRFSSQLICTFAHERWEQPERLGGSAEEGG